MKPDFISALCKHYVILHVTRQSRNTSSKLADTHCHKLDALALSAEYAVDSIQNNDIQVIVLSCAQILVF